MLCTTCNGEGVISAGILADSVCPFCNGTGNQPCSIACQHQVDKPEHADEHWHHIKCPNHTTACCPMNPSPSRFYLNITVREDGNIVLCYGGPKHGKGVLIDDQPTTISGAIQDLLCEIHGQ